MIDVRTYIEDRDRGMAPRYDVTATWRTYDPGTSVVLAQIAIRHTLALRLSLRILPFPELFALYGIEETPVGVTSLRRRLLDEATEMIELVHGALDPAATSREASDLLQYVDARYRRLDEAISWLQPGTYDLEQAVISGFKPDWAAPPEA